MGAKDVFTILAAGAAAVFFFSRKSQGASDSALPTIDAAPEVPQSKYAEARAAWGAGYYTQADLDALTSMLFVETSWAHNQPHHGAEEAGIINVAMNRAAKHGVSLKTVVAPPGKPVAWNAHPTYRDRYAQAQNNARFPWARAKVRDILEGRTPNPVGDRVQMLHISQMSRCTNGCPEKQRPNRWRCIADPDGVKRCLPVWAVSKAKGGTAEYEPIAIGEGWFS